MDLYITIILGILGIGAGIAIPVLSNQIVIYKYKKTNLKDKFGRFTIKIWVLVGIANGFLWIYAGIRLENIFAALLVALIFAVAILISIIDLQVRLIPNDLVLLMICLGGPFQILYFGWMALLYAFICMITVGFFFALVGKLVGLHQVGAGDVKLAGAIGWVLGYPHIKIALIWMSAAILIFCLGGLTMKKVTMHSVFPFAPFIMFGTICALIDIIGF